MSNKELEDNAYMRLAESIAALLSEGVALTVKEIARELRRRGAYLGNAGGIRKALSEGTEFHSFVRLPTERWTLSDKAAFKNSQD